MSIGSRQGVSTWVRDIHAEPRPMDSTAGRMLDDRMLDELIATLLRVQATAVAA